MRLVAVDTETYLFGAGLKAPPLVCVSWAEEGQVWLRGGVETEKDEALELLRDALNTPNVHIGGVNISYDFGVVCARDPSFQPLVFAAADAGRLHDCPILEALHDNARGLLFREASGRPFSAYSQQLLEARYLGLDRTFEKKGANSWRLRYGTLDGRRVEGWPQEAVDYPRADAKGALGILQIQLGAHRNNLQCEAAEVQASWALHLSSCWGVRTDPEYTAMVVADLRVEHERSRREFFEAGIVRVRTATSKEVAKGAVDVIDAAWLDEAAQRISNVLSPWAIRRREDLAKAQRALAKGKSLRFATDEGRLSELVTDAYQGNPPTTPMGQVSTSADTLDESDNEILEKYSEAGGGEKLLSTFAQVLEQGTAVPINAEINTLVATQRTSYRKPNLQQLPRYGVRECFVPRAGWVYCSCDYAALELCTLAQVELNCFDASAMADAINAGQDLHIRLAAEVDCTTYELALARKKAHDKSMLDLRQSMKAVNFGVPGLMGPAKLVLTARKQGVRFCELAGRSEKCSDNPKLTVFKCRAIAPTCVVCLELATHYRDVLRQVFPEMVRYHEVTPQLAKDCENGTPFASMGTGMLRLETNPSAVSNHFFQNLAAQGAKAALYQVSKESYADKSSVLYGNCRPVVFIHDEIVSELREEHAHECALRVAEIMVREMRRFTPDVAIKVEPALARRWFKAMEPVYDSAKRLRPWWPCDGVSRKADETVESFETRRQEAWTWAPDLEQMGLDTTS